MPFKGVVNTGSGVYLQSLQSFVQSGEISRINPDFCKRTIKDVKKWCDEHVSN